jgi:hypothetical protein
METKTLAKQSQEILGMLMIGDGALSLLQPDRHLALWRGWSGAVDRCIEAFAHRPMLTRLIGAAEAGLGLLLASQQTVFAEEPQMERAFAGEEGVLMQERSPGQPSPEHTTFVEY